MKIKITREQANKLIEELKEMYKHLKESEYGTKKFNSVSSNWLYCHHANANLCKTVNTIVFEYFFVHLTFDEMEKYPTIIFCNELSSQVSELHILKRLRND